MTPHQDKYRGATILDLDPPPSLSLNADTNIRTALDLAYERDYTHLCIVSSNTRALLGYVPIPHLSSLLSSPSQTSSTSATSHLKDTDPVSKVMQRFRRKKSEAGADASGDDYTVITPDTPLEELEDFFAGRGAHNQKQDFAIVTDAGRKFVVGVVTKNDLEQWLVRRGGGGDGVV